MGIITKSWNRDLALVSSIVLPGAYLIRETFVFKIILVLIFCLYIFYQYNFRYWKNFGIPEITPYFPLGNVAAVFRKCPGDVLKGMYDQGVGKPYVGVWILFRPALLIRDPELIKRILVKDFAAFPERGIFVNQKHDPLAGHIFSITGAKWRNIRVKLTPTFTTGKMKAMFPQFLQIHDRLKTILENKAINEETIDVKEWAARYSTDLTTLTAFGIHTKALDDPNEEFRKIGQKIFEPSFLTILRNLLPFLVPDLSSLLGVVQTPKEVTTFFIKAVHDMIEYREKNNIDSDDFFGVLLKLKNKGKLDHVDVSNFFELDGGECNFTIGDIAAQAFVFFVAGFETTATTISWAIYELTANTEIQRKVRKEIHDVLNKYDGKLTYDALSEMKYLDRVIDETLRKYPPVPLILRKSNKTYTLPDSNFTLPAGTAVYVSVHGLQRDPKYFPDPNKFNPDRFTAEEKLNRHHYAYLPFGEGPRNCFGMRYSLMQKKVGLIAMLNTFEFSFCSKSPVPMKFDPDSFVFSPKGGMFIRIKKIRED